MSKTTVLIVEDEAIVAADLAGRLGQLGYEVAGTAATGEEAVEMALRLLPRIVLMDIRLRGSMDGIQAAEAIRGQIDLPVIYLTAHSDSLTLERAKLSGPFGYILKPFEESDLTTTIEMALFKHDSDRQSREYAEQLKAANETLRDSRIAALNLMEDAIIARREAEETSDRLRLEIAERKRAEEALNQAKEAAETANRAKSRFLANMSHELRTPMTGVLGMLDLALGGFLEAEQRDYLETAHNSARGLLHIINEILDLSTIESGKFSIEDRPFSLGKCLSDALGIFTTEARRKGLELVSSLAGDLPQSLVGDPLRLRQVLVNLIGNALKFTEQGRVEVTVAKGGMTPEGRREYVFSVSDTGIGIPLEKQHLLFQSFSQVDDSDTRSYGGSGLGLAICREIVTRMGGVIGFESEQGEGSRFTFTIPFGETDEASEENSAPARPLDMAGRAPAASAEGRKTRLLIAEDEPVIRQLLDVMLRLSNFDPDFAEDGRRVVEMWDQGEYDLVLMDVQMPHLDGFSATRAIREREQERGGHTPIIAMTAHAYREDENRCLDAGMDAFISKPIDLRKSIELINELLSQRNGEG